MQLIIMFICGFSCTQVDGRSRRVDGNPFKVTYLNYCVLQIYTFVLVYPKIVFWQNPVS